jgi:hypothetical protein
MENITDSLIEVLVRARVQRVSRRECADIVRDVFDAPWSAVGRTDYKSTQSVPRRNRAVIEPCEVRL